MSAPHVSGDCWIHFAFDVAAAIDLERAEILLPSAMPIPGAVTTREAISNGRRTPPGIQFQPKPLRVVRPTKMLSVHARSTEPEVEITLYDFGAISIAYRLRIVDATLESLRELAVQIAETASLAHAARLQVERVIGELGTAARRAAVAETVEDYLVFHLGAAAHGGAAGDSPPTQGRTGSTALFDLQRDSAALAAILRSAEEPLSEGEIADAMACVIAYGRRDLVIIDWSAAIIVEPDAASAADLLAVLEFANVELVEMRFLDDRLDSVLDRSYNDLGSGDAESIAFTGWSRVARRERRRLAAMHMDSALLFEGVNNAIKLLGDQYLARVHRLAARRLHLNEWDASIRRKIETLVQALQGLDPPEDRDPATPVREECG